jgi:hypothetical protein
MSWLRYSEARSPDARDQDALSRALLCLDDGTVGEAHWRDEEKAWWWANTAPGDFDGAPDAIPEGRILWWQPMPAPPAGLTVRTGVRR